MTEPYLHSSNKHGDNSTGHKQYLNIDKLELNNTKINLRMNSIVKLDIPSKG